MQNQTISERRLTRRLPPARSIRHRLTTPIVTPACRPAPSAHRVKPPLKVRFTRRREMLYISSAICTAGMFLRALLPSTITTWRVTGGRRQRPAGPIEMGVRSSKKQLILESCANLKRPSLGLSELRRVQQDLRQRLVPAKPP